MKKIFPIFTLLLIVSIGLTACGGGGADNLLDDIKDRGYMVVSTDPNYEPQSFLDPDAVRAEDTVCPEDMLTWGEMKGFDVDVAKEIANRLGVEVCYATPDWDVVTAGNWGDRWDVSVGSMTVTTARQEVLDFVTPYYYSPAQFAAAADAGITSWEDLEGQTICLAAATTYLEYNKYFAKDAALERRFQPIHVGEPEDDKAMLMMRGIKDKYEGYHGIHITDEAIAATVKLSRRYIAGRQLPDKSIDLLDTAGTRIKMSLTSKPPKLELLISELKAVEMEIGAIQKDVDLNIGDYKETLKDLNKKKTDLEKEIKVKEERWTKECELVTKVRELRKGRFAEGVDETKKKKIDADLSKVEKELKTLQGDNPQVFADVTAITVAEVIESWTGIQVGNMTKDEMTILLQLEDELRQRVVGQDHAIKQISDVIRGAKVGMKKEEGPIGVFLMVGPSGVGKTELARTVAEALFGDERFMVTLNMTEYQNEYNTSRLIGADPGLVGYGEGGALSEPVRRRPYSVVLLDEIEKANSAVIDLFMQVFDRGMLQDADRRNIDFSNTLIFMTSNLASDVLFQKYNEGMTSPDDLLEELRPYLNQHFRPEFLGRVKPIVFLPLATEVMSKIVELKLGKLSKRLKENQNIMVEFAKPVVDDIVTSCTRAETGARNIDAIIDRNIAPDIAEQLLGFMAEGKSPASLKISKAKDGGFQYKFV